ncbi:hypothetical protein GDO78_010305 [Eleutherodactylus coqui]|uniref:Uncharacterized protein n=1 Tax=Eleutherodactylus coqui TaxID=57060 RepID=A0A8J6K9Y6_ELECQ|nr:hypothetical protein GDO78_010305 [Eleutherodactylus coqui]
MASIDIYGVLFPYNEDSSSALTCILQLYTVLLFSVHHYIYFGLVLLIITKHHQRLALVLYPTYAIMTISST